VKNDLPRRVWIVAAALVAGLFLIAASRHADRPNCEEHCKSDEKECSDICRKYANAKALSFCLDGCKKVAKDCQDSCSKRQR
jgi:hypothetical protein